ncbi:MAG: hypothetical protein A2934_03565 [Candidatus Sungbacteria bacterium RIFCSPLOWO2_01_FULL_47_10]|uniref:Nudix hydrolase domain-containing protein n=1 Tax=Candidatus Sungbacteria bacterium RIFCSPLOWO2_01_FULL_47_10 TaxID=1802276 RepID=A0A1G2L0R0_9BACT|nr:MAG: hypothetical protein A2934_03565 [Candidatus Sungbacteria bacterium RIFCSPLOWO2_01_FULL_47_10]
MNDHDKTLQVGVKAFLKNTEGKFLFVHRSSEKYPDVVGRWDIVGGRIHPGKPLMENLAREIREETGLELFGIPKLVAAQDIFRSAGYHIVRLTFVGEARGEVRLDMSEHNAYRWYTTEELKKCDDIDVYVKELLHDPVLKL